MKNNRQNQAPALFISAVAAVLFSFAAGVPGAYAVLSSPDDDTSFTTNGAVNAMLEVGNYVYVGGSFTNVGPPTGSIAEVGNSDVISSSLMPKADGPVYAIISDGSGGWYIGGNFTNVGGTARNRIAHIDSDGTIDSGWNPDANDIVRTLVLDSTNSVVYAGGDFTSIGGQARAALAALNVSDGQATLWDPAGVNGSSVRDMKLNSAAATVYIGGTFTSIGGQARFRIAALNASDATATTWNPGANNTVETIDLTYDDATIYAGGAFTALGGALRNRIGSVPTSSSTATDWDPNADNSVISLSFSEGETTVYVGGQFTNIGGQARNYLAQIVIPDGTATTYWDPNVNNYVWTVLPLGAGEIFAGGDFTTVNSGATDRLRVASFRSDTATATPTNIAANDRVRVISQDGGFYVGGDFTSLNVNSVNNIAVFDKNTGGFVDDVGPSVTGGGATVRALEKSADGSTVYIGGDFTTVGSVTRNNVASFSVSGNTVTAWDPNASNGIVRELKINNDGTVIYVGGAFTTIAGVTRNRIAAINTSDGTATSWDPSITSSFGSPAVETLQLKADDSVLYVGGDFGSIGGTSRIDIGAINTSDGTATSWDPSSSGVDDYVYALALTPDERTIYAGGEFTSIGGQSRNRVAAIKTSNAAATSWDPNANNTVYALGLANNGAALYVGGAFTKISSGENARLARFNSPRVQFTLNESSGSEATTPANIEVSLSEANTVDSVVAFDDIQVGGATGGGVDYTLASSSITILAGNTTANIEITIVNDSTSEGNEPIILELSSPKSTSFAAGAITQHIFYITDNDSAPSIAFTSTSSSGSEATTTVNIQVTLSAVSGNDTGVYANATGGTATQGTDYSVYDGGAILVPAGTTTANLRLTIVNDAIAEGNETVELTISSPQNATLGANTVHTYTITDND